MESVFRGQDQSALDMGEKLDKKVRQDDEHEAKGCPKCGYQPFAKICMACGYEKQAPALVEALPGEMREVVLGKKKLADDHRHLWAQVCTYARSHSKPEKQRGRAWNLYKNITGQTPSNLWSFETTPNVEITRNVRNKITSLNVAYSKARAS
jgi:DNA repair protein RadD